MKKPFIITFIVFGLILPLFLVVVSEPPESFARDGDVMVHNLALMPFVIGRQTSEDQSVLDLEPDQVGMEEDFLVGVDAIMTRLLQHALDKRFGNVTVSQEEVMRAYRMISDAPYLTPRLQAKRLAEQLGVEYIVVGNIWRYSERSGNSLASDKPASVAFKLHLIHIPSNRRIWVGVCDKTQQTLSENLFQASDFIKQKGQWVRVEELAKIGIEDLVKQMPL